MEKNIKVEITGVTPLLVHRFASAQEENVGQTKRKSETTKENDVNETLYKTEDGKLYHPADSIKQALIEAGKGFKKGKSNLSKIVASFVLVSPEQLIHKNQKWVTDRRAVVIPSTKGRVMRNRGKFLEWVLGFDVRILDSNELESATLKDIIEYAGKYVGIGDYRPQKKGMYGTFQVTSFK